MNCQFCLTGRLGLRAQLSAAQIVEQARPCPPERPEALPALGGLSPARSGRPDALPALGGPCPARQGAQAQHAWVQFRRQ